MPQDLQNDPTYLEVSAKRMQATLEDIREPENYDFECLKCEYPGVPLKHFVDNFIRYEPIEHDEECPTDSHEPFFLKFIGEKNNSTLEYFEPEQCPKFPRLWNRWHDEFDVDKLRKMPMKSSFKLDLVNHVSDPAPM